MKINPEIFKEYDIRGLCPKDINSKIAYIVGFSFAKNIAKPGSKIVLGRDIRASSRPLARGFARGATDAGADIIDLGQVMSPMLYWSVYYLGAGAGAMITASHNPKKYNGIKFITQAGPVNGELIKKIIAKKIRTSKKKGAYKIINIADAYLDEIAKDFKDKPIPLISVRDRSSAARLFSKKFADKIGMKNSSRPEFFVSFDYDADRLMIFDKNKKEARGDFVGAVIADSIAKKGDTIIFDLRCSKAVPEYFRNKGVKTIISRAGNYNIKKLMKKTNAVFGMELTGHYFFKKFHFHENPFYALLKFLRHSKEYKENARGINKIFSKFCHSGIINFPTKNMESLVEKLAKDYGNGAQSRLDGLTVEFSNWWFNIRQSHTEPAGRLVIEAKRPQLLALKKKELLKKINP